VVIDRAAAEIVYRTVDSRTSLVVRQYPDEARLRARAYLGRWTLPAKTTCAATPI
jgi:hypothetical protein